MRPRRPASEVVAALRDAPAVFCEACDGRTVHVSNADRSLLLETIARLRGALVALRTATDDLGPARARADKVLLDLGGQP